MLVACVSSVDLPMPGSPPTSSTEPRTKPPPVTRSSSVIPEERRGASWLLPASDSSANCRPLRLERMETGTAVAPISSDSVFHSPQASHLPCQREYAAPQFWQTKESEDLAICDSTASVISARARVCQDISLAMRLRRRLCAVPTFACVLLKVSTLRFAHPTASRRHEVSFPRRVVARVVQSRCPS